MIPTPETVRWRKSSFSDGQHSCIELSYTIGAVRDSKNPTGPVLTLELSALLAAVKTGRFDR